MKVTVCVAVCSVALLLSLAPSAYSSPIYYPSWPGGGNLVAFTNIQEDSSTDPNVALYGAHTRSGNKLTFGSASFNATASNGTSDTTQGVLRLTIEAFGGNSLKAIKVSELGQYSLSISGDSTTNASVLATLTLTDADGIWPNYGTAEASYNGLWARPTFTTGQWSSGNSLLIDLSTTGIKKIDLVLTNTLTAHSQAGTNASITKQLESVAGSIEVVIPEPTTIGLVLLGVLGLLRKRS